MPTSNHLFNIGHRGARSLAPENTMLAFIKAWQTGAHGVETDVSVTSDGQLILFHDTTFIRTTNIADILPERKKKSIHTFSWQEIQAFDAGSWFYETDPFGTIKSGIVSPDEQTLTSKVSVPLLKELLLFVKERSWFVNIEIKTLPKSNSSFPVVERVLSLLDDVQLDTSFFSISSFHHPFLKKVLELRPEIEVNALIGENILLPQSWGKYEFSIYNANVDGIDLEQIRTAQKHGCRVNLYTVNDAAAMTHFLKAGVEKIITDFPQILAGLP